jgi:hypothetical protein
MSAVAEVRFDGVTYVARSEAGRKLVSDWLEANGIDAKRVLLDPPINVTEGRIRCTAVVLGPHGELQYRYPDDVIAAEEIDVPVVKEWRW